MHVLAIHVDNVPAVGVEEIVNPTPHAEQSTLPSASHNVPPLPPCRVGVPLGQVQVLPVH